LQAAGVPLPGDGTPAADSAARTAVLVVGPRPSRPYGLTATEVIGSFSPARLAADLAAGRIDGHAPVTAHADAPPPTAGAGQSPRDALEALGTAGTGPDAVLVLRDGRAHAVLTRAELLSALEPRRVSSPHRGRAG
jgi:cystathionine beta-synthase